MVMVKLTKDKDRLCANIKTEARHLCFFLVANFLPHSSAETFNAVLVAVVEADLASLHTSKVILPPSLHYTQTCTSFDFLSFFLDTKLH